MGRMPSNCQTRTHAMRQRPSALLEQLQRQIAHPHISFHRRNPSVINQTILKCLQTNDRTTILAFRADRGIGVPTALSLHLYSKASGTEHGIEDVLMSTGKDDDHWDILETVVVGKRSWVNFGEEGRR